MAGESKGTVLAVLAPVERAGGGVLRRMLDMAIDGTAGLPGARAAAANVLQRKADHEAAIDALVLSHTAMASAQGFVTNLGGLASAPVTVPANLAGLAMLELRLVAAIAHLRGYDLDDPRVRSAIMMTLLGPKVPEGLPASPLLVATAPVFDADLDKQVSERVLTELVMSVGGRRAASLIGRRIPVIGGGVGAVADGWNAHGIARWARSEFVVRRVGHA